MKKLTKLSLIVLIPLVLGIALVVIGGHNSDEKMIRIGEAVLSYGLPITMFSLVVIGLILMITGRTSDDKMNGEQPKTKEQEATDIADVNSSHGYESHRKSDEYMAGHLAENYRNSTPKEKVLGWLFFGFLMGSFALIFVFGALRNITGIIVCLGLFCGTIFISLIVKVILEQISMRVNLRKLDGKETFKGVVTACLLSSTTSTGGSHRRHTTRITGVVYRVNIEHDGQQYTAYSRNYYEQGEGVFFIVRHRSLVAIVDEDKVAKVDDTKF